MKKYSNMENYPFSWQTASARIAGCCLMIYFIYQVYVFINEHILLKVLSTGVLVFFLADDLLYRIINQCDVYYKAFQLRKLNKKSTIPQNWINGVPVSCT